MFKGMHVEIPFVNFVGMFAGVVIAGYGLAGLAYKVGEAKGKRKAEKEYVEKQKGTIYAEFIESEG